MNNEQEECIRDLANMFWRMGIPFELQSSDFYGFMYYNIGIDVYGFIRKYRV